MIVVFPPACTKLFFTRQDSLIQLNPFCLRAFVYLQLWLPYFPLKPYVLVRIGFTCTLTPFPWLCFNGYPILISIGSSMGTYRGSCMFYITTDAPNVKESVPSTLANYRVILGHNKVALGPPRGKGSLKKHKLHRN